MRSFAQITTRTVRTERTGTGPRNIHLFHGGTASLSAQQFA